MIYRIHRSSFVRTTMPPQKLLVVAGAVLGLIPIALGIAALVTKEWLKLGSNISSLVICDGVICRRQRQMCIRDRV